uniref:Uncharacterized protein n=1 Tax=Panagrolaimus superbus TaxID=310955 RepID=A0A914YNV0_9BILA
MAPNDTEEDPRWGFSISKPGNGPRLVLLECEDGTIASASPEFMLALIIKEHLKVIRKDMKGKNKEHCKEIGVHFFEVISSEVEKRLQEGFLKAFDLLNIKCHFI